MGSQSAFSKGSFEPHPVSRQHPSGTNGPATRLEPLPPISRSGFMAASLIWPPFAQAAFTSSAESAACRSTRPFHPAKPPQGPNRLLGPDSGRPGRTGWTRSARTIPGVLRQAVQAVQTALLIAIFLCGTADSVFAVQPVAEPTASLPEPLAGHLAAGEFGLAERWAREQTGPARDQAFTALSLAQYQAGMSAAAEETAAQVDDPQLRRAAFEQLASRPLRGSVARGGAAMADFDSLIEMITSTVSPDSWEEVGGPGAIESFPGGVLVDPSGLMDKLKSTATTDLGLGEVRRRAHRRSPHSEVRRESRLRKISLNRLERQLEILAAAHRKPDEVLKNLAGLNRLQYLLLYPESGEIVLAGPAGDWTEDREGRQRSVATGRPCLQLDDLLVVLRQSFAGDGRFGCSITPTREGLANVQQFVQASAGKSLPPGRSESWIRELGTQLGPQRITVSGINPRTRTAVTLVEADYHMKLVGLGLEESVLGVTSYLDQLNPAEPTASLDVLRWWFTLNYDQVQTSPERDAFALRGPAVQVLSENELLTLRGERVHTGKSDEKNRIFAQSFTEHYESLAAKYPVYGQLRNIFDLALFAEIVRAETSSGRLDWKPTALLDETRVAVPESTAPTAVNSVLSHRFLDRSRFVVAVSGGVSVDARRLLANLPTRIDTKQQVPAAAQHAPPTELHAWQWWWD